MEVSEVMMKAKIVDAFYIDAMTIDELTDKFKVSKVVIEDALNGTPAGRITYSIKFKARVVMEAMSAGYKEGISVVTRKNFIRSNTALGRWIKDPLVLRNVANMKDTHTEPDENTGYKEKYKELLGRYNHIQSELKKIAGECWSMKMSVENLIDD